jgi:hypothetical protein
MNFVYTGRFYGYGVGLGYEMTFLEQDFAVLALYIFRENATADILGQRYIHSRSRLRADDDAFFGTAIFLRYNNVLGDNEQLTSQVSSLSSVQGRV